MTIKEAIEWLNTDDFHSKGFEEATGIAIKALEKQIPQKSKHGCCHNCGTSHLFISDNLADPLGHPTVFCWNCGQAIDWSEEEMGEQSNV